MEALLYAALIVILVAVIYRSGKKKDGFVNHWSRGRFMRELNKKMEDGKTGDIKTKHRA